MSQLDQLEDQSVYILREAYRHFDQLCMLWSIGKDSTVMLWLARKAFFGQVPFPLVHIDTAYKIPAMIEYRDRFAREWGLEMVVGQNREALASGMNHTLGRLNCCRALKPEALQHTLDGSWPRMRLAPFLRDVGVLAMAPVIRAEVGRDAVRRLKQALGNSYLLALDRTVWDGRVPVDAVTAMGERLKAALSGDAAGHALLYALFDRQGRSELCAWAQDNDRALGDWVTLLHPRESHLAVVLPSAQVQMLHDHHLKRGSSA